MSALLCSLLATAAGGCAALERTPPRGPNLSATRATAPSNGATTPDVTTPRSTPTARASQQTTPSAAPLKGTAPGLTTTAFGPATLGAVASAGEQARWNPTCQAWDVLSTGGTVTGHALTKDRTTAGTIYAARVDHAGVKGPGGIHVGSTLDEVRAALAKGKSDRTDEARWWYLVEGEHQMVAQIDLREDKAVSLMLLPASTKVADFPTAPLCR